MAAASGFDEARQAHQRQQQRRRQRRCKSSATAAISNSPGEQIFNPPMDGARVATE
jgi:hypothetical protein